VRGDEVKKSFGASVKFWRNQLGISQEALADRADVHRTYVCDVEGGARNVSLETIERLAKALEISTASLFLNRPSKLTTSRFSQIVSLDELVEILVVEDNADDAAMTMRALKRAKIANHIQLVGDGAAALDFIFCKGKYSQRRLDDLPQMILLDLNLPKINGLEVLRRIKADQRTRSISIVVLTVSSRHQDAAECRRLGVNAYIAKPVDFQNFSEVIPKLNLQWGVLKPLSVVGATQ